MKYLKIKATKTKVPGGFNFSYPKGYDAEKVTVLQYETFTKKGKEDSAKRGDIDDFMHCVVDDKYGAEILKSSAVTEMAREDFILDADKTHEAVDKITDPDGVTLILAKQARGVQLEQNELDSIDPAHPDRGINTSPTFRKKLDDIDSVAETVSRA